MSEFTNAGMQLREFLRGLLGVDERRREGTARGTGEAKAFSVKWGPRVALEGLKELYAPQKIESFVVPPGGIDNLGLHSTDIFMVPGRGEYTVDFRGYFRVARSDPTSYDWADAAVRVNITDLRMSGEHEELGKVDVRLNPDVLASGQIFPAGAPNQPAKCRIATGAIFRVERLGVSVFNKEPILLMNEHVTSIPPVNDPSGHALLFHLPLYDVNNPDGEPLAYLTSLRYGADDYLDEKEVRSFQMDDYVTRSDVRELGGDGGEPAASY